MKRFERGSEWRKWDLHVHVPDTKMSSSYARDDNGEVDWERYCRLIEESDVDVIGITDYYSCDAYFLFRDKFQDLYPKSSKVFLPNIELRLNVITNKDGAPVNLHLLFRPDVTRDKLSSFIACLYTEKSDKNGRKVPCNELETELDYKQASVTMEKIRDAIAATFGKNDGNAHVLVIAADNRADAKSPRKAVLSDEVDKFSDAVFGNSKQASYFLQTDRFEDPAIASVPKPVFKGCDAHSFDELERGLGKTDASDNKNYETTWVKADLTYEGLLQTLAEPESRVRIQALPPDRKEPYKVISKVVFSGSPDFPEEVVFNPNLNAIIGSRSAGKSSLLAYIAHAVDPEYTVEQQNDVEGFNNHAGAGPAAGYTWNSEKVKAINCSVEWVEPGTSEGKIIYIPQNSLHAISNKPEQVTAMIEPALFRNSPGLEAEFLSLHAVLANLRAMIRDGTAEWFARRREMEERAREMKSLGDRKAVVAAKADLEQKIETMKSSFSFTEEEFAQYRLVTAQIEEKTQAAKRLLLEMQRIAPYLVINDEEVAANDQVVVTATVSPRLDEFAPELHDEVQQLIDDATSSLTEAVKLKVSEFASGLKKRRKQLLEEVATIEETNKALISKHEVNRELTDLVTRQNEKATLLAEIDRRADDIRGLNEAQTGTASAIQENVSKRSLAIQEFQRTFDSEPRLFQQMRFEVEFQHTPETQYNLSAGFNKTEGSDYLDRNSRLVLLDKAQEQVAAFLNHLASGAQKINTDSSAETLASEVLSCTEELRFAAVLEDDRIGGFGLSSMTPGKQALFALILILNQEGDGWPLLIDQPEDDLDAHSIYEGIVPLLMEEKAKRQIIMVSHNANLVVGADAEEVVVANRHAEDSKNRNSKLFDYLTGSLEYSAINKSPYLLHAKGIREHACTILDGGEDAFRKRVNKYRI